MFKNESGSAPDGRSGRSGKGVRPLDTREVSYTDLIVATLPQKNRGIAGSLTMLTRTIGVILAAVILSSAVQALEARHLVAGRTATEAFHAAFSWLMTALGVPAGASTPCHVLASYPATPASLMVGRSSQSL